MGEGNNGDLHETSISCISSGPDKKDDMSKHVTRTSRGRYLFRSFKYKMKHNTTFRTDVIYTASIYSVYFAMVIYVINYLICVSI